MPTILNQLPSLALPHSCPHCFQDRFARKDVARVDQPLLPEDPLQIDEEEGPPRRDLGLLVEHTVAFDRLEAGEVAEQRVGELERIRERLLREGIVRADPQGLDVQLLELAEVGLPGRQVRRSRRDEGGAIELEQHDLLPSELAQGHLLPRGGG